MSGYGRLSVLSDFLGVLCSDLVDMRFVEHGLEAEVHCLRSLLVVPADLGAVSLAQLCQQLGSEIGVSGPEVLQRLMQVADIDRRVLRAIESVASRHAARSGQLKAIEPSSRAIRDVLGSLKTRSWTGKHVAKNRARAGNKSRER